MLLRDLYRYRASRKKNAREAWLSACLSELLDQDPALRIALLAAINVKLDGAVTVEHQRRFGELGASQIADVLIENEAACVILECKDGARPDLRQMQGYAKLDGKAVVVLVAGATAIDKHTRGKGWEPFRKLSWQRIHDLADPTTKNPLTDWFRMSFRELLDWAGQAPVSDVQPAQVLAMLKYWERSALRQKELRAAVAALQPAAMAPDDERWEVDGLSAWWTTTRATDGMDVRGLGINAEMTPRGAFDWSLDLRPTSAGPKAADLERCGFEDLEYEKWWQIHLFRGQASGVWESELANAVAMGRAVLKSLKLRRGQSALPTGATPVKDAADVGGQAGRTNARIWSAARSVREALAERMGGKAGHQYATIFDGSTASGWFWPEIEDPGYFRVCLGWGKAANKARYPAVAAWWQTAASRFPLARLHQDEESFSSVFSVDLREVPLRDACDTLVELAGDLFRERRGDLFSAKGSLK
jgi:hypothetical protein